MAELRVSGPAAALIGGALLAVSLLVTVGTATGADRVWIDRSCDLKSASPVSSDGRTGSAAPTGWGSSAFLRPRGTLRSTMIFVDFDDAGGDGVSTPALLARLAGPTARWVRAASYRRARLEVAGHHEWLRMPRASTSYWPPGGSFRPDQYITEAIATAAPRINFAGTEIVYIVPAPGSEIFVPVAQARPALVVDGTTLRRFVILGQSLYGTAPNAGAAGMVQGTAHLFSLPYLDDPSQAGAAGQRWAGSWDPMGEAGLLAHPSAWSKRKLGWLGPGKSMICIRRGTLTRSLAAISRRRGLRSISVRVSKRRRYVIEARRRHGADSRICEEGILIWSIDGRFGSGRGPMRVEPARRDSDNPARACRRFGIAGALDRAPFQPGQAFKDRAAGLKVKVLRQTRKGYRVRVSR